MEKDMVFGRKLRVNQNWKKEDWIEDDLVGAAGSVTPFE